jgi:hypothetical protein
MAEMKQAEKRPEVRARQEREQKAVESVATSDLVSGDIQNAGLPAQMQAENQDDSVKYTLVGSTGSNKGVNIPFGEKLPAATVPGASVPVAAERSDKVTAHPTGGHLVADTREATIARSKD